MMRPVPFCLALAVLTAPAGLAAQQPDARATVAVGTASARRGQVAYGAIRVPAGVDSATDLPIAVVNGTRPGPVVALVAGSHGTEYTSIVALTRIIGQLDPRTISGTVIVAPGDPAGTQTQRALAAVADQVVKPADVVIDLHGGDLDEDLRPYSYWFRGGQPAQDSASRALALAFGLDHIIVRDFDLGDAASRRNLGGYAMSLGKTVLVAEAGRSGTVEPEDLRLLTDGVLNVLGGLRMIDRAVRPVEHPVWLDASTRLAADSAGMFFAMVGRGATVAAGAVLGYTTDYLGRRTGEVRSPTAGVVTFIRGVPSMWKGATLAVIGREHSNLGGVVDSIARTHPELNIKPGS